MHLIIPKIQFGIQEQSIFLYNGVGYDLVAKSSLEEMANTLMELKNKYNVNKVVFIDYGFNIKPIVKTIKKQTKNLKFEVLNK